ncbi:MAG TPA: hypothetical protein VGJ91_03840 [Polyangiaceae bacterium]|jgi:hypothetical protein
MEAEHPLTRQIRLAEVGVEGQARLSRATLCVAGSDGSLAEFVYLHRAGVERLSLSPNQPAVPFEHASLFRHVNTRRLGAGAWRALRQIRNLLAQPTDLR